MTASESPRWWNPQSVDRAEWTLGIDVLLDQWPNELFSYLVVEDRAEGVATLEVSPWPRLDDRGRPYFDSSMPLLRPSWIRTDGEAGEFWPLIAVDAVELDRMRRVRFGNGFETREMQAGDAFGAAINPSAWVELPTPRLERGMLRYLFRSPLYDVTAEARELARIALAASIFEPASAGSAVVETLLFAQDESEAEE